jgi:GNAT superfamily N-acetyltransferase
LKKWVETYCLSFNIDKTQGKFIYQILQRRLDTFKFVFAEMNDTMGNNGQMAGCGLLFSYRNCIALYCLGTIDEYRHKNIATNIMNFSTEICRKKGYQIFGLQTLKSDNLLSFYLKKGFVDCYNNKIYEICNR